MKKYLSYIKESIDRSLIENVDIAYHTYDEMIQLAILFTSLGYTLATSLNSLKRTKELEYKYYFYDEDHFVRSQVRNYDELIQAEEILKNKVKRIERPEIDPYGEEDWGWEKMKESLTKEEGTRVMFSNLFKEYGKQNTIDYLNDVTGQRVFFIRSTGEVITNGDTGWEIDHYRESGSSDLHVTMRNGASGTASGLIYFDPIPIGKKIKKVERPDIDPYNEDDWGWEEIKERFEIDRYVVDYIKEEDIQTLLDIKYEDFKQDYESKEKHNAYARQFINTKTSLKLMDGDKIIGGYILYPTTIKSEFEGWLDINNFYYDVTPLLNKKGVVGFSLFIDKKYRKKGLGQMLIDHVMNDISIDFMMGYAYHSLGNIKQWMKRRYLLMDVKRSDDINDRSFYITIETKGVKLNMTEFGKDYASKHQDLNWGKKQRGLIKENLNEAKAPVGQRMIYLWGGRTVNSFLQQIHRGNNEENRRRVLDDLKPLFGKKIVFTNEKEEGNRTKDRIIKGAFWKGRDLYFEGTKKDYKVNLYGKIGYFDKYNVSKNIELDPYGEEDWDMNESAEYLTVDDFKIGDRIRHKMSGDIGVVTRIDVDSRWPILCRYKHNLVISRFSSPSDLEHYKTKQIFSENDPYGEEEWEVNESIFRRTFEDKISKLDKLFIENRKIAGVISYDVTKIRKYYENLIRIGKYFSNLLGNHKANFTQEQMNTIIDKWKQYERWFLRAPFTKNFYSGSSSVFILELKDLMVSINTFLQLLELWKDRGLDIDISPLGDDGKQDLYTYMIKDKFYYIVTRSERRRVRAEQIAAHADTDPYGEEIWDDEK